MALAQCPSTIGVCGKDANGDDIVYPCSGGSHEGNCATAQEPTLALVAQIFEKDAAFAIYGTATAAVAAGPTCKALTCDLLLSDSATEAALLGSPEVVERCDGGGSATYTHKVSGVTLGATTITVSGDDVEAVLKCTDAAGDVLYSPPVTYQSHGAGLNAPQTVSAQSSETLVIRNTDIELAPEDDSFTFEADATMSVYAPGADVTLHERHVTLAVLGKCPLANTAQGFKDWLDKYQANSGAKAAACTGSKSLFNKDTGAGDTRLTTLHDSLFSAGIGPATLAGLDALPTNIGATTRYDLNDKAGGEAANGREQLKIVSSKFAVGDNNLNQHFSGDIQQIFGVNGDCRIEGDSEYNVSADGAASADFSMCVMSVRSAIKVDASGALQTLSVAGRSGNDADVYCQDGYQDADGTGDCSLVVNYRQTNFHAETNPQGESEASIQLAATQGHDLQVRDVDLIKGGCPGDEYRMRAVLDSDTVILGDVVDKYLVVDKDHIQQGSSDCAADHKFDPSRTKVHNVASSLTGWHRQRIIVETGCLLVEEALENEAGWQATGDAAKCSSPFDDCADRSLKFQYHRCSAAPINDQEATVGNCVPAYATTTADTPAAGVTDQMHVALDVRVDKCPEEWLAQTESQVIAGTTANVDVILYDQLGRALTCGATDGTTGCSGVTRADGTAAKGKVPELNQGEQLFAEIRLQKDDADDCTCQGMDAIEAADADDVTGSTTGCSGTLTQRDRDCPNHADAAKLHISDAELKASDGTTLYLIQDGAEAANFDLLQAHKCRRSSLPVLGNVEGSSATAVAERAAVCATVCNEDSPVEYVGDNIDFDAYYPFTQQYAGKLQNFDGFSFNTELLASAAAGRDTETGAVRTWELTVRGFFYDCHKDITTSSFSLRHAIGTRAAGHAPGHAVGFVIKPREYTEDANGTILDDGEALSGTVLAELNAIHDQNKSLETAVAVLACIIAVAGVWYGIVSFREGRLASVRVEQRYRRSENNSLLVPRKMIAPRM